ncbi:MAG: hypothetical protein ACI81L_003102 [Verrucomicrobiales bacterium]|jgi:hypothetical protein
MDPARRATAQGALVVVIGAMFLTWSTDGGSRAGTETGEGQLVALASLATIALIQLGWRPAWIGAGFIIATLIRQLTLLGGDVGMGLIIGIVAVCVAAAAMIWDMFANIPRPEADDAER